VNLLQAGVDNLIGLADLGCRLRSKLPLGDFPELPRARAWRGAPPWSTARARSSVGPVVGVLRGARTCAVLQPFGTGKPGGKRRGCCGRSPPSVGRSWAAHAPPVHCREAGCRRALAAQWEDSLGQREFRTHDRHQEARSQFSVQEARERDVWIGRLGPDHQQRCSSAAQLVRPSFFRRCR